MFDICIGSHCVLKLYLYKKIKNSYNIRDFVKFIKIALILKEISLNYKKVVGTCVHLGLCIMFEIIEIIDQIEELEH